MLERVANSPGWVQSQGIGFEIRCGDVHGTTREGQAIGGAGGVLTGDLLVVQREGLQRLLDALAQQGYEVVGPTVRDSAIVYDEIQGLADLPEGWTDEHAPGHYRLVPRGDRALFGYVVGPHAWKRFLHPPVLQLWQAERGADGLAFSGPAPRERPYAFIGVRACELRAIAVQDRVFLEGAHVDTHYRDRRAGAFLVAVNCGEARGTCFCVSMGTGPKADVGFDLALTELDPTGDHRFLLEVGSERGAEVAQALPHRPANEADRKAAAAATAHAVAGMGRQMPAEGVPELLARNLEHPRWDEVAERCLTCGNCTMVCPTCFCTTVEEDLDLTGKEAGRTRKWLSCFGLDFSYIHGGSVRSSPRSRYRQWMTHKLSTWVDQLGTSGCVGCGRCITWCPVGIDITEEVRAIAATEQSGDKP